VAPPPAEAPSDPAAPAEPEPAIGSAPSPEGTPGASTTSFEDATSVPEPVDVNDEHLHLTDNQLTGPMRGVLERCAIPRNAKVTIRTAVQNGHAIGVTVDVVFDRPKSKRRMSRAAERAAEKAEAKTRKRIVACADRAVRALTWPPSRRRDAFTTVF
jgi:hypothetical protein